VKKKNKKPCTEGTHTSPDRKRRRKAAETVVFSATAGFRVLLNCKATPNGLPGQSTFPNFIYR
jgi:hypothetical protein